MSDSEESSLIFVEATIADLPEVRALVESAYRGDSSRRGWTTEADYLDGQRTDVDALQEIINHPMQCILLAREGSELVASVHLKLDLPSAMLGMFAVTPTLQGGGIGRRTVVQAESWALNQGASLMRMYVISLRASLIAWYQRLGYSLTSQSAPFPYGDARFGVPKRDDLMFVVMQKRLPRVLT